MKSGFLKAYYFLLCFSIGVWGKIESVERMESVGSLASPLQANLKLQTVNFPYADYHQAKGIFKQALSKENKMLVKKGTENSAILYYAILHGFEPNSLQELLVVYGQEKQRTYKNRRTPSAQLTLSDINATYIPYGITALHLACGLGDEKAARWLLDKGAQIDKRDTQGWTAAHFVALSGDTALLHLLHGRGADMSLKDSSGGTALDLWQLTHMDSPDGQQIPFWDEETGGIESMDGHVFKEKTGATFVNHMVMRPSVLAKQWAKQRFKKGSLPHDKVADDDSYPLYQRFNPKEENYYIKHISHNDKGEKLGVGVGYGLYARRHFEPGEVVGEYTGEWMDGAKGAGEYNNYRMGFVDAQKFRGFFAFSADSLPNCLMFNLRRRDGLPYRLVCRAIEPIEPHQPIVWDYGTDDVKVSAHVELRPQALEHFARRLPDLLRGLSPIHKLTMMEKYNRHTPLMAQGSYILDTPTALIQILVQGWLEVSDFQQLITSSLTEFALTWEYRSKPWFLQLLQIAERKDAFSQEVFAFYREKLPTGHVAALMSMAMNLPDLYAQNKPASQLKRLLEEEWELILAQLDLLQRK